MAFHPLTMVAPASFDSSVQAFHVMCEDDIGFDKFTTGRRGVIGVPLRFPSMPKSCANTIGRGFRQDIDQLIHRSAFQSFVGQGNGRVHSFTWFQTSIRHSFTSPMNTNQSFEEVHIG